MRRDYSITSSVRASSVGDTVGAELLGCFEINHQLELGRLLDWDIARPRPAQNLVGELSGATVQVKQVWSIGHQASRFHEFSRNAHIIGSRAPSTNVPISIRFVFTKWVGNDVQRIRQNS